MALNVIKMPTFINPCDLSLCSCVSGTPACPVPPTDLVLPQTFTQKLHIKYLKE